MTSLRIILCVLFLTSFKISAQDKDLKDLYTNFTTAINSVLLTKQGAMELSGFLSYTYLKTDFENDQEKTQSIIQLEPQFSYFIMDNISFGLLLSYSKNNIEYKSPVVSGPLPATGAMSLEQTSAGPIAKIYFAEDKLRPFIFADYLFMFGDSDGSAFDLGAGIFYHVSGNFGLNLFGKYGIIWPDEDYIDSQHRIFVGLGISNFIL